MARVKRKLKTFYASLHVTRIEDWRVEAETAEEARLAGAREGWSLQARRLRLR
jgi:hypothetical protein